MNLIAMYVGYAFITLASAYCFADISFRTFCNLLKIFGLWNDVLRGCYYVWKEKK